MIYIAAAPSMCHVLQWLDFTSTSSLLYLAKNPLESAKWSLKKPTLLCKKYLKKLGNQERGNTSIAHLSIM